MGGGAGDLQLATKLGKKLGKTGLAEITPIEVSPTHIWKPLLHEVAAGILDSHEDENIFALGDCAACPWIDHEGVVPPRAQATHQQAQSLYKNIR